jgi:hypothetical protein
MSGYLFAIATTHDGALLLNLKTGAYFRTALEWLPFWRTVQQGGTFIEATAALTSSGYVPDRERLAVALQALASPAPIWKQSAEVQIHPDGFMVLRPSGPNLINHADRRMIRAALPSQVDASSHGEIAANIASAAMTVIARKFLPLHASCVVSLNNSALILTGHSGAGKTTTARAFAKTGDVLLAEDILLVEVAGPEIALVYCADALLRDWTSSVASVLQSSPCAEIPYDDFLVDLERLPKRPVETTNLSEVLVLGDRTKASDSLIRKPLDATASLAKILENSFWGLPEPDHWRLHLDRASALAERYRVSLASWPEGLDILAEAVQSYKTTLAG